MGREVQLLRHGMPVEAHAVAHAVGEVLEAAAVGVHARDIGVGVRRDANIARRADIEVELAVRPEGQVLPAVRLIARQDVVDHLHGRRIVELVLDAGHLRDPRDLRDVERAVLEGHAVGQIEALGDHLHLALAALVHHRVDIARHAAADEQRALVAPGHGAGIVDPVRPQLRLEAGRHLDLGDRDLARRLRRRRLGDRRECRIGQVGGLPLLPGRGRLRRGGGGVTSPTPTTTASNEGQSGEGMRRMMSLLLEDRRASVKSEPALAGSSRARCVGGRYVASFGLVKPAGTG